MSDLLDTPPSAPRRQRGKGAAALKLVVALLVVLGLLAGAAFAAKRVLQRDPAAPDYRGAGSGEVTVQVKPGENLTAVGATLMAKGVVKSREAFRKATLQEPDATKLQPGYYTLRGQMSAASALALLLDPASRLRGRVTLPEGVPLSQALDIIAKQGKLPIAQLRAAVEKPVALGLPDYAEGQVEGFLFPATYDIDPDTTAVSLLQTMVQRFDKAAVDLDLAAGAAKIGRTPYEVLTVASLIEKETAFAGDRAKVARVAYNRLAKGQKLQFDSTVNYVREEKKAALSLDDLKVESDYNTYQNTGLPPTPIGSPGALAIEAALNPAPGNFIYFITVDKATGAALFTDDYDEFLRAKKKAQAEGVY